MAGGLHRVEDGDGVRTRGKALRGRDEVPAGGEGDRRGLEGEGGLRCLPGRDRHGRFGGPVAVELHPDGVGAGRDVREDGVRDFAGLEVVKEDPGAVGRRGDRDAPGRDGEGEVDRGGLVIGDRDGLRSVGVAGLLHGDGVVAGRDVLQGRVRRPAGIRAVEEDRGAVGRRGDGDAACGLNEGEVEGGGLVIRDCNLSRGVAVAFFRHGDGVGADGDPVEGGIGHFTGIGTVDEDCGARGRRGDGEAAGQGGQREVDGRGLALGDRDRRRGVGVAVAFQGDDVVAGRDVRKCAVGHQAGVFAVEEDRGALGRRGDRDAPGRDRVGDDQEGRGGLHPVTVAPERRGVLIAEERRHVPLIDADLARAGVVPGVLERLAVEEEVALARPGAGGDGDESGTDGPALDGGEGGVGGRLFGSGALACAAVEEVEALVDEDGVRGGGAVVVDDREQHPADRGVAAAGEGAREDGGVAILAELTGDIVDGHAVGVGRAPQLLVCVVGGLLDGNVVKGQGDVCREDRAFVLGVGDVEPGGGDGGVRGDREIRGGPVGPVPGPVGGGGEVGAVARRPEEVAADVVSHRGGEVVPAGPALAAVAVGDDGLLDGPGVVLLVRLGDCPVCVGDDGDRHVLTGGPHGLVGPGDGGVRAGGEAVGDGDGAGDPADVESDGEGARVSGADVRDLRGVGVVRVGEDLPVVRGEGRDREIGRGRGGDGDVVRLYHGVAAAGVRDREVDGVGADGRVGVGRVLLVAGRVVPEVPGPRGQGAGREVGELHGERGLTGGRRRREIRDRHSRSRRRGHGISAAPVAGEPVGPSHALPLARAVVPGVQAERRMPGEVGELVFDLYGPLIHEARVVRVFVSKEASPGIDEGEPELVHGVVRILPVEDRVPHVGARGFPVLGTVGEVVLREGLVQRGRLVGVCAGRRSRVAGDIGGPGIAAGLDPDREVIGYCPVHGKQEDHFVLVAPPPGVRHVERPGLVLRGRDLASTDGRVGGDMDRVEAAAVLVDVIRVVAGVVPPDAVVVRGPDVDVGVPGEHPAVTASVDRDVPGPRECVASITVRCREVDGVTSGICIRVCGVLLRGGDAVAELPGPGGRASAGSVGELHGERGVTGGRRRGEVRDRGIAAGAGDRDVVYPHFRIVTFGVRHREVHGIGAGARVGVGRALVGRVDDAVVLEVPGPGGRGVGRGVGELHRERGLAGGDVCGEVRDGTATERDAVVLNCMLVETMDMALDLGGYLPYRCSAGDLPGPQECTVRVVHHVIDHAGILLPPNDVPHPDIGGPVTDFVKVRIGEGGVPAADPGDQCPVRVYDADPRIGEAIPAA